MIDIQLQLDRDIHSISELDFNDDDELEENLEWFDIYSRRIKRAVLDLAYAKVKSMNAYTIPPIDWVGTDYGLKSMNTIQPLHISEHKGKYYFREHCFDSITQAMQKAEQDYEAFITSYLQKAKL